MKSQNAMIREYLEAGHSITPIDALNMFGCFRLGARIADLKKQGMDIRTEIVHDDANGKHWAKYYLSHKSPEVAIGPVGEMF
jgi:hypothetical protein